MKPKEQGMVEQTLNLNLEIEKERRATKGRREKREHLLNVPGSVLKTFI